MNKIKSQYPTKPRSSPKTACLMAEIQTRLHSVITHLDEQDETTRNRLLGFNRIRTIYETIANAGDSLTFDQLAAIIDEIDAARRYDGADTVGSAGRASGSVVEEVQAG